MSSVIVIGGGISGLASAALLARDGHEVTLLEANAAVGGRAGSWEKDGFRFDTGPSWYLMPEVFDHFYKLLGTSADEQLSLVTLDPGYRVIYEGVAEPVDVAASRDENLQLFEDIRRGSGLRLHKYLNSAELTYDLAKRYFLYTTFESFRPLVNREVLRHTFTLVRLLLRSLASRAAATVRDDRLRKILGYPAVFLGSSPYLAPSMYHLMSHLDLADGVRYPVGGFARVISSIADLAKAEGVTIVTDARVGAILSKDGAVTGVEYTDASGAKQFADADIVVSTADLHHSETVLLPLEQQTYPQTYWDKKTPGPSALLLNLGVTGDVPELEHHTLFFARDWRAGFDAIFGTETHVPSPASLYVCKPSGVDEDVAPDGSTNLFVLVPIPADPGLGKGGVDGAGDASIEKLADAVIEQIALWANIPDLASRIVVRRTVGPADFVSDLNAWRGTALGPAHTLRQSAFFRAGNVSKKVRGLYFAGGSTIPGIGLPMCLISAELVVKRLHGDVSTGPMPEPLVRSVGGPSTSSGTEAISPAAVSPAEAEEPPPADSDADALTKAEDDTPAPFDEVLIAPRPEGVSSSESVRPASSRRVTLPHWRRTRVREARRRRLMPFLYLLALAVALTGMVVLDRRFRLFFWRAPIRAAIVLVAGLAFFLVWDLQGIRLDIFFRGETSFMTGWQLAPELPVEEPSFCCCSAT